MHIACLAIRNFRKLKAVRIDLTHKTTLLVGANNSGKTTATEALRRFVGDSDGHAAFQLTDFTLSNRNALREIGEFWNEDAETGNSRDQTDAWDEVLPSIDIWFAIEDDEVGRVQELTWTLADVSTHRGVRLRYQPKNMTALREAFVAQFKMARETEERQTERSTATTGTETDEDAAFRFPPIDLVDFLDKPGVLARHFHVQTFKLNPRSYPSGPDVAADETNVVVETREMGETSAADADAARDAAHAQPVPIARKVLDALVRIDVIRAQRGLSDDSAASLLSQHAAAYYRAHLDPHVNPTASDIDALRASHISSLEYQNQLQSDFEGTLAEIRTIGYPGASNPKILLSTILRTLDSLEHSTRVTYGVGDDADHVLPEGLNGLGYQNLVLIMFRLLHFRDKRHNRGKAEFDEAGHRRPIVPVHLVAVEEPEAYLHAQVQQVFIRHAYDVLARHDASPGADSVSSQLLISTHSSHIAKEADLSSIRYFRRVPSETDTVPASVVENFATLFEVADANDLFARRYLQVNHYNLLFADAAILVEGTAEQLLLPNFIKAQFPTIDSAYVEILGIGGAHAHRLRPLIDILGIPTLVVTDVDAMEPVAEVTSENGADGKEKRKRTKRKIAPQTDADHFSDNDTLRTWMRDGMSKEERLLISTLAPMDDADKILVSNRGGQVRFAFQTPHDIELDGKTTEGAFASTFEDAIVLANIEWIAATVGGEALLKKFRRTIEEVRAGDQELVTLAQRLYEAIGKKSKADFALDLLAAAQDPRTLEPPPYITAGLTWLEERVRELPLVGVTLPELADGLPDLTTDLDDTAEDSNNVD